jgi:hypothetical protein
MAKKLTLAETVRKHGGHLRGPATFDGVQYSHHARFNSDEQIDACFEALCPSKSDTSYVDTYLTTFFSI